MISLKCVFNLHGIVVCDITPNFIVCVVANPSLTFFADFSRAAILGIINGRTCLIHDGHKFIKYGSNENTKYWRCTQSFKYKCEARILTRYMNGCEMLKIQNNKHDHISLRVLKKESK